MTVERIDDPGTGAAYALVVYVILDTLEEVDQLKATGMVITEYDDDDHFITETVASYLHTPA